MFTNEHEKIQSRTNDSIKHTCTILIFFNEYDNLQATIPNPKPT